MTHIDCKTFAEEQCNGFVVKLNRDQHKFQLRTLTEKFSEPTQSSLLKSVLLTLRQVRFPLRSLLNLSFTISSCSPSKRYTQLQNPFWPALSALNRIYTPRRPGKGAGSVIDTAGRLRGASKVGRSLIGKRLVK